MESRMEQLEHDNAGIREKQQRMNEEIQKSKKENNLLIQQLMRSIQDQFAEFHTELTLRFPCHRERNVINQHHSIIQLPTRMLPTFQPKNLQQDHLITNNKHSGKVTYLFLKGRTLKVESEVSKDISESLKLWNKKS